jgi:hypothetical protein
VSKDGLEPCRDIFELLPLFLRTRVDCQGSPGNTANPHKSVQSVSDRIPSIHSYHRGIRGNEWISQYVPALHLLARPKGRMSPALAI